MPQTISKALNQRLIHSEFFRRNAQDLHFMTGLEVIYMDYLGRERLRFPRRLQTPLRDLDHRIPSLASHRQRVRQELLARRVSEEPQPWIEDIHRIQVEQQPVGFLVLSAWRNPDGGEEALLNLWTRWVWRGDSIRWKDLRDLWMKLPVAEKEKQQAWSRTIRLMSEASIRRLEENREPALEPERFPPLIRRVCGKIQEDYAAALTLKNVAGHCGVSPEHLSRTFHKTTGLHFKHYLAETRIQAVCAELRETGDPIGDIAYRNGFTTLSRFNRTFREINGMTPRDWRKRQFRTAAGKEPLLSAKRSKSS